MSIVRGVDAFQKALGGVITGNTEDKKKLPETEDLSEILRDGVKEFVEQQKAKTTSEVLRNVLMAPEPHPQPTPLAGISEVFKSLKDLGLDANSQTEQAKSASQVWQSLFSESRKEADDSRKENTDLNKQLVTLAINNMNQEQRHYMEKLLDRLDDMKTNAAQRSPVESAMDELMQALVLDSVKTKLNLGGQQQNPLDSLMSNMATVDKMTQWLAERSKNMGNILGQPAQPVTGNTDALREMLLDERERLKIQLDQKRWEKEIESKERTYGTVEKLVTTLAPVIAATLNKGGPNAEQLAELMKQAEFEQVQAAAQAAAQQVTQPQPKPVSITEF